MLRVDNDLMIKETCDKLIHIHKDISSKNEKGRVFTTDSGIEIVPLNPLIGGYSDDEHVNLIAVLYTDIIVRMRGFLDNNWVIDRMDLRRWPEGSSLQNAIDPSYHRLKSIVFLNDDFDGGEILLPLDDDTPTIAPRVGEMYSFHGDFNPYGVSEVSNGQRYTMELSYKRFERYYP